MKSIQAPAAGPWSLLHAVESVRPVPSAGQVLIRVEAASVNFSDVMRRRGDPYPIPTVFPYVPGSEVAGTIVERGDGVDAALEGARVFALAGDDASAGYAEYALARADRVIPIPPGLTPEVACGLLVAGVTPMLMLTDAATVGPGCTVLVQGGAGGVGGYAIRIAKALGARVVAAASSPSRRERARAAGADAVVDSSTSGWAREVRAATAGRGADVVLEGGGATTIGDSLTALAPFGTLVVYGFAGGAPLRLTPAQCEAFFYVPAPNQSLRAFNLAGYAFDRVPVFTAALERLIGMVLAGTVQVDVEKLPLDRAAEAHRRLEAREAVGKLVLVP